MEPNQEIINQPVNLEEYPRLSEAMLCEFNRLLETATPRALRKSVQQAMFPYLVQSKDVLSYDFQEVMQHLHLLIEFFDVLEEQAQ